MTNCDDLQLMFFEVSVVYLSFRAIRKFYFGYKLECNWMQVEHLLCFVSLLITLSTEGKIERKSERERVKVREIVSLDIGAVAFAVVRCGSRLIESYIWLVIFGARVFLSPTSITSPVLTPPHAE